jgi:hypothetical protein
VDVCEDETGFGGLGVETLFESADETDVVVVIVTLFGMDEPVVVESVGSGVGHEGRDVEAEKLVMLNKGRRKMFERKWRKLTSLHT